MTIVKQMGVIIFDYRGAGYHSCA